MIPLGYMLKNVASPPPDWMKARQVEAVHSLSHCVSADFADYIPLWKHNGWWLFDTPELVKETAASQGLQPGAFSLFYYEAYDRQFDRESEQWLCFAPDDSIPTQVTRPQSATLSGYDVTCFCAGTSPECSPLSCNDLAADLEVNERCLFDSFEQAFDALEQGNFAHGEPGPYRIIAVYEVEDRSLGPAEQRAVYGRT